MSSNYLRAIPLISCIVMQHACTCRRNEIFILDEMTLVIFAATENPYKHLLKELKKPDGKVSKYYSLPDLKDPRIGECNSMMLPC
jgi:hypothetical protein